MIYLIRNCFKRHNLKEIKFKYDLILVKLNNLKILK